MKLLCVSPTQRVRAALPPARASCDGTIPLTRTLTVDKDTMLDASGHQVTISGQQSNRVFHVKAGVKFTLLSVTVADGKSDKGGGLFNEGGEVIVLNCAFLGNVARGADAAGGAVLNSANQTSVVTLVNTILAASSGAGNASGTLTDGGHNLSSDASCAFTAATSLNNTDPKLLPLGDYGGPTPTMALAADSPARDHGDDALAPPTDQRGVPRPIGSASDIGAFEFVPPPSITPLPSGAMRIELKLQPSRVAVLQATSDFRTWTDRQTNQTDAAGVFTAIDTDAPLYPHQFYRTKTP